ncbi:MAG: sulfite exporter TauE/SafE family protein [Solirubrobacteraceae bacterium]
MTRRRALVALVLLLTAASAALLPGSAAAHPLGNFTVNRLDVVKVSQDRVEVRWILDQAEIPTFQERDRPQASVLAAKRAEALRGLQLRIDGRRVELAARGPGTIELLPGQGGLKTTRVELLLSAARSPGSGEVTLRDATFDGRLGWRGMIPIAGEGVDVTSSLPAEEPTRRLRRYPQELLSSPADQREITLEVKPGSGALTAPRAEGGGVEVTGGGGAGRGADGFAGLFDDAASGQGVLILLMLAAFAWGALHALSPGHGKAMVAAYLVGARGTARHAVILGAIVTVTHTIGVFALGLVTLALSQYLLPEDLYPWLNLAAGLLVLVVGGLVLRARLRGREVEHGHGEHGRGQHGDGEHANSHADHDHDHAHRTAHTHDHGTHGPAHGEHTHDGHGHAGHSHSHGHGDHGHSHVPDSLRPRTLIAAGASAGLIPCPSALVVLLGAVSQQKIALGLLLIVIFSLGLAATLTVLGLVVVYARGLSARWRPHGNASRVFAAAPAVSAMVIVVVGFLLTARAIPDIM